MTEVHPKLDRELKLSEVATERATRMWHDNGAVTLQELSEAYTMIAILFRTLEDNGIEMRPQAENNNDRD